jgi:hypothetical protein
VASIVEIGAQQDQSNLRQRWSHYFVLIYAAACLLIAINLRGSIVNETVPYSDLETGIRARYPAQWLIDGGDEYVFRVRNISRVGFKTSIEVSVRPVSLNTTTRNLLDALSLSRAQTLTAYRVLAIEDGFRLPNDVPATRMRYVYVDVAPEAALQRLPTVVEAFDLIAIREGQAIIISFVADTDAFEEERPIFERFVNEIEF